jgi:hypothetical protein
MVEQGWVHVVGVNEHSDRRHPPAFALEELGVAVHSMPDLLSQPCS